MMKNKDQLKNPKGLLVLTFSLCCSQLHAASMDMSAQLFDTGTRSQTALSSEALAARNGWVSIPEDQLQHTFKGDAVLSNGKLVLVLRRQGRGAEVYATTLKGAVLRSELVAVGAAPSASLTAMKIVENTPTAVTVDASFKSETGSALTLEYELRLGQPFVQTQPRSGVTALRVIAPCRFAVLPDFFADDMVVDANELPVAAAELPSDNFFLHLLGAGEAIVMAVWHPAKDDIRLSLTGQEQARSLAHSEITYGPNGKAWVAILDGPGIWHHRDVAKADADKILPLDWRPPYAAHWRVDWERDDRLTDSWEMLTQKPDGGYVKHGWYGQPEAFGNVDWQHEGRTRWTTVLGSFQYPCWIDKDGAAFLQPLKKGVRFQGPTLIYPITRLEATPLGAFTVVDVMRATLGVGPCEYVLDVEGQKKTYQGRPTCASRTILNNIYSRKAQKEEHAKVLMTLDEVIAFVRHIRGRIEEYLAFAREMVAYLEAQKQAHPELATTLTALQKTTGRMDAYVAQRKEGIKTPEFATQLVTGFRTNLVGYEGSDALAQCKAITAALVDIGGNQDELVGECRLVVKILRQQAAAATANDPRMASIAKEVRRRTQQMLRNPTSYEAPRH
jgi:hypothetical protein